MCVCVCVYVCVCVLHCIIMYMSLYIPVSIYPSWTLSNSCTTFHSTQEAQKGIIQPLKIDSVYVCMFVCLFVCVCACLYVYVCVCVLHCIIMYMSLYIPVSIYPSWTLSRCFLLRMALHSECNVCVFVYLISH